MTVLLDTNISLDFLIHRQPFFETVNKILIMIKDNYIKAYVSASSVTDIYYIMRKYRTQQERVLMLTEYFKLVDIVSTTKTDILRALKMEATDFEDAVTFQIAKRKGVDYIITRDKKGFTDQAVKTVSPEEFLKIVSLKL
ncbi:type II toxin-antitoxin system VapC family toxin [Caldicoprobacter faecalis]|uniref:Predicted nucleic acid-binding protein, contains PIN domain n=1 Tax=Caldicoprobacter faecalis TaxID=937334 RepID=A0A1I5WJK6_9FIRM|nr:PIN domain-containing protein [Caldicoprobacter faecalis]SFQ19728.1 Predicted nucleic acid-binding protein, contains PIN domain [Caldicoprobacter faecalis]